MSEIHGFNPLPSKDLELYKKDFQRGSKLIKEASEEYQQTTEPHKKEQLKKAMSEALIAMNQILNNVLHKKGEKLEKKLFDDYTNFIADTNSNTMNTLNKDIDKAQHKL